MNNTNIGLLLTRSLEHNDNKGASDKLHDPLPCSLGSAIFIAGSYAEFIEMKAIAYQEIHNPI